MMLHFCSHHGIIPVIDSILSFDDAVEAFALMNAGKQFGKIVLHHAQKGF
jgi:D-arabinose 1-dehydrogenase-like Zn-dependent alcohol dehydrogenase